MELTRMLVETEINKLECDDEQREGVRHLFRQIPDSQLFAANSAAAKELALSLLRTWRESAGELDEEDES